MSTEEEIRHKISDVDEEIRQKYRELQHLQNKKVDLKNDLFVLRYNRGERNL